MIYLQCSSGRGPAECELALQHVIHSIGAEAKSKNICFEIIDVEGSSYGISSALLKISGINELDFANSWNGSIQWICPSSIRPSHKRKRWFVSVNMIEIVEIKNTTIVESDLEWQTMRSSGPGGQNVNKTSSAVRLSHKPSGIVVTAQEERSQHQNKSLALGKLNQQLILQQKNKKASDQKEQWNTHNNLERGNAIRTYNGQDFKLAS